MKLVAPFELDGHVLVSQQITERHILQSVMV